MMLRTATIALIAIAACTTGAQAQDRTPCLLNRSSPSLGYKRRDGEIGSKSVLENTAIYFIILIDSFDCIAIN
jgi:hypothetical protein